MDITEFFPEYDKVNVFLGEEPDTLENIIVEVKKIFENNINSSKSLDGDLEQIPIENFLT